MSIYGSIDPADKIWGSQHSIDVLTTPNFIRITLLMLHVCPSWYRSYGNSLGCMFFSSQSE